MQKYLKDQNNYNSNENEVSLRLLFRQILKRKKLFSFSLGSVIFLSSLINIFLRLFFPVFEGGFSILISDPINSGGKGFSKNFLNQDIFKDIALNTTDNDINTLIAFLKSPIQLNPIEEKNNVNGLNRKISIDNPFVNTSKASGILDVKLKINNIETGKNVLKDLSESYLTAALAQKQNKINEGLEYLNIQIPNLQERTIKLQKRLADFREKYSLIEPLQQGEALKQKEAIIDENIEQLEAKRDGLMEIKDDIKKGKLSTAGFQEILNSDGGNFGLSISSVDQALIQDLLVIEDQLSLAKSKFKNKSQVIQRLEIKLDKLKPLLLKNQIETVDIAIQLNEDGLKTARLQKEKVQNEFQKKPELIKQYNNINQELTLSREYLIGLISAKENLQLEIAQKRLPWTIVAYPQMNLKPIEPNLFKNFIFSIIFGLSFGMLITLIRNRYDNIIHDYEDLKDLHDVSIIGEIPFINKFYSKKEIIKSNLKFLNIVKFTNNNSTRSESFLYQKNLLSIYNNIRILFKESNAKTIAITSSSSLEGKTSVNILLSKTISDINKNILLIDADLRNPSLHKKLGIKNNYGLSNLLIQDDYDLSKAIKNVSNHKNWDVITAGEDIKDPLKILSSNKLEAIIEDIKKYNAYDLILFDTPPILDYVDTSMISEFTDGIIILVDQNSTRKNNLDESFYLLKNIRYKNYGLILNNTTNKDILNLEKVNQISSNLSNYFNNYFLDISYKIYNKFPKTFKSSLKSYIKKMLEIIIWIDN